ncbi:hypothetical protein HDU98_004410 [Podochytrium sp. JEL0797]|nr:hypothetical protein HDU98_004410 [Podochytrium sp. JEL0797]
MKPAKFGLGDAGPLSCCALALSNFVSGCYNIQAGGIMNNTVLTPTCFFYGGMTQLLAGMWMFATDIGDATIVTSYGAFWVSLGYILAPETGIMASYSDPNELQAALGFFNLGWTFFTFVMLVANLKTNYINILMIFSLLMTYGIQAVAGLSYHISPERTNSMMRVSGFFGFTTALLAWWTAAHGLWAGVVDVPMFPVNVEKDEAQQAAAGPAEALEAGLGY